MMRDLFHSLPDGAKFGFDLLSFATLLGSLASVLPHVAALLTIIWTIIRIIETDTVQRLLGKKKD